MTTGLSRCSSWASDLGRYPNVTVTEEHYMEIDIADSITEFRSSVRRPYAE